MQSFLFPSPIEAILAKNNLMAAIEAGTHSFDIIVDTAESTIFNLNSIQAVTVIDLAAVQKRQLKDTLYQIYQEKLFADARKNAEEILEETSFGIGR